MHNNKQMIRSNQEYFAKYSTSMTIFHKFLDTNTYLSSVEKAQEK